MTLFTMSQVIRQSNNLSMAYQSIKPSCHTYDRVPITYLSFFLLYLSIKTNEYTIKDSFEFSSMLDNLDHHSLMASMDVDTLFTNRPLEETIYIITNQIYGNKRKIKGKVTVISNNSHQ